MDYYSNHDIENFDRLVEFLGFNYSDRITTAKNCYIKLEDFIFPKDSGYNFANHNLSVQELNARFNKLLTLFAEYEASHTEFKQYRFLSVDLVDVRSTESEDLFLWSYYNHRFAASQGQDMAAMEKWHKLEENLDVGQISKFKQRRENNLSFFMHVINNYRFFDHILFGGLNPQIKNEIKYGLDIAEEQYIHKLIKENQAKGFCRIVDYGTANINLNLIKRFMENKRLKLKAHILANSRQLNSYLLQNIRNLFAHLSIADSNIEQADFVFLVNDLDKLASIPQVDTDKPIITVDFSQPSTPNFSYMLLKDDGFDQVHGYAKRHFGERSVDTMVRALCCGIMTFINKRRFVEQLAVNYMDDYFHPLSKALNTGLAEFKNPIKTLTLKLEKQQKQNK